MDTLGGSANSRFLIKSHNHPRNRPYRLPGLQNERPGLKNERPGVKNHRKFDYFASKKQASCSHEDKGDQSKLRNGTVAGYARSALDNMMILKNVQRRMPFFIDNSIRNSTFVREISRCPHSLLHKQTKQSV